MSGEFGFADLVNESYRVSCRLGQCPLEAAPGNQSPVEIQFRKQGRHEKGEHSREKTIAAANSMLALGAVGLVWIVLLGQH